MKIFTSLFLAFVCLCGSAYAQQKTDKERQATLKLTQKLSQLETDQSVKIKRYLAAHPTVRRSYVDTKGNYCYLHRIDVDGKPVYYQTRSNLGLATSINTSKLWNGGGLGLNLQGQGMEVSVDRSRLGVWEPGPTRTTHQEFTGRAITRDTPPFSTSMLSTTLVGATDHAAHVTGTMIGAGIRADARGMANQARIDCYETTSELTEQQTAASEGMLVSNHSYGPTFQDVDASKRGVYDDDARNYDEIAFNNRNYLQFHAAGNDRSEANNIKYDILLGGALAKNVVAIGAVQILPNGYTGPASVVMSDFSSFGPADDGRVKPDLVAPGVQITSAYSGSDDAYSTIDGTSMASPGAAGSMFLLQQHYRNTKNAFMRAASLKGLGIHTAEEAGAADGPDYSFGWGLLNMEKAVKLITNSDNTQLMEEASLATGATYRKMVTTTGGPFKTTICWTDAPGTLLINPAANDRTPILVNDLDLRIVDVATNQVIATLPWKLNPNNPDAAATRGDNIVDNVEQIYVANLPAGQYYVQVTHKGSLQGNSQDFSLFATGLSSGPVVSGLVNATTCSGVASTSQSFSVIDSDVSSVSLVATSTNTTLVPAENVVISGTGGNRTVTVTPVAGQSGTVVITLTATNSTSLTGSASFTLTVSSPVVISGQPSSATISAGQSVSFTAAATGDNLTYQWQLDSGSGFSNLTNDATYSGVTSATVSVAGATTALNGYQYRVLISNGACSATATAATLTVTPASSLKPDLTAIVYVSPSLFYGTGLINVVVDVFELSGVSTTTPVVVRISRNTQLSLSFNQTATIVGNKLVNNNAWSFDDTSTDYYTLTTLPNQLISAGGKLSLGLSGTLQSGSTSGIMAVSATVSLPTETNLSNNSDADKVDYRPK